MKITVLCASENSNYKRYPSLDIYDINRDAYLYTGSNPVITHAPCQQWSKLKAFAKDNPREKELAYFCLKAVQNNGGIFEHPKGSSFFKHVGVKPTHCVQLNWFGFPAKKETLLYAPGIKFLPHPISFNAIEKGVSDLAHKKRSDTPFQMIDWFINSIHNSY